MKKNIKLKKLETPEEAYARGYTEGYLDCSAKLTRFYSSVTAPPSYLPPCIPNPDMWMPPTTLIF